MRYLEWQWVSQQVHTLLAASSELCMASSGVAEHGNTCRLVLEGKQDGPPTATLLIRRENGFQKARRALLVQTGPSLLQV
jgi:hypothetical protein